MVYDDVPGRPLATRRTGRRASWRRRSRRSPACTPPSRSIDCCRNADSGAAIAASTSTPPMSATRSPPFARSTSTVSARTPSRRAMPCLTAWTTCAGRSQNERECSPPRAVPRPCCTETCGRPTRSLPRTGTSVQVRLIDWDEAAVGPAGFDVSTFLLRFDPADRPWILDAYRRAVDRLAGMGPSGEGRPELDLRDGGLRAAREPARLERRHGCPRRAGLRCASA